VVLRSKKNGEETSEGDNLEDRLNSFAVTKQQAGRLWLWTALEVDSRVIIFNLVGGGTLDDARIMVNNIKKRIFNKPLFVSDELIHYKTAFCL
jgi:transposase-like protein